MIIKEKNFSYVITPWTKKFFYSRGLGEWWEQARANGEAWIKAEEKITQKFLDNQKDKWENQHTMKKIVYHCQHCNDPMTHFMEWFVCMKEGCPRYGLISVVGKREEIVE